PQDEKTMTWAAGHPKLSRKCCIEGPAIVPERGSLLFATWEECCCFSGTSGQGGSEISMRYQTKLLTTAGLLLAMSLSAAALAYWGVAQSHSYLLRSRVAHQELERQLQLSRHTQQLFKAWTDTLLTGVGDRPLGAAYLHKVIESDLSELEQLTKSELALVGPE